MRIILCTAVLLVAGCVEQQQKTPLAGAVPPPSAPVADAAASETQPPALAETEDEAQKRHDKWAGLNGYKIIKRDGVTKYCKSWQETASRIRTNTTCLTAAQIERQEQDNLRALSNPAIAAPQKFPTR
jgi:hypothetical protein